MVFVVIGLIGIISFIARTDSIFPIGWTSDRCHDSGFACNIVSSVLFTAAPLLITVVVFLAVRYRRVPGEYIERAKEKPAELVETSGSIIRKVVGRDDLCDILQDDLNASGGRRPHVLVGGLGIGKTAVLVQLTKTLAERDAVPVPIRLRDATGDIDFLALGKARFLELVSRRTRSQAEGERVWRQLLKDDRVVVLADGLEEAFADEQVDHDRHHRVRVAVHEANREGFPALVIASRPHEALKALEAAKIHLEPLSESAALSYILQGDSEPRPRIATVVETADVTETPLYLQIAHDLQTRGLLEHRRVDPRGADRVTLRMRLMEGYLLALVAGELEDVEVPIKPADREVTVAHLQALACVGLRDDTQQVTFAAWDGEAPPGAPEADRDLRNSREHLRADLEVWLSGRIETIVKRANPRATVVPPPDMQAAAATGVRLGLVQHQPDGVRFPHSIMQAYLGSKAMGAALQSQGYGRAALRSSGRELLLALVMYCRGSDRAEGDRRARIRPMVLRELLKTEPEKDEGKLLDIAAAAIEIDTAIKLDGAGRPPKDEDEEDVPDAPASLVARWRRLQSDDETILDAKFAAVARLADSAHRLARQEALARGDVPRERATDPPSGSAPSGPPPPVPPPSPESSRVGAYARLYEICRIESSYRVRLAAAQEIGAGGDDAWVEIRHNFVETPRESWQKVLIEPDQDATGEFRLEHETERRFTVQGWLLPMLVGTTGEYRHQALASLAAWMKHVGDARPESERMPLSIESALAQGFKHAANRRPRDRHEDLASRVELDQAAREMLGATDFWYSRMTLLHALCLSLMTRVAFAPHGGGNDSGAQVHDIDATLKRWLRRPKRRKEDSADDPGRAGRAKPHPEHSEHRFVTEAAALVRRALETGRSSGFTPEAFLWIDESGIATQVGSQPDDPDVHGRRSLWIPPSAGWMGLDPRAQQLVADVMILLNLAERGGTAEERERRLKGTNRPELPLCLTGDRRVRLKPAQTVGMVDVPRPGDECSRECEFDLCPYPPRGQQPHRVELSEAFCRRQKAILNAKARFGPKPGWQTASRGELRQFWSDMEDRART